jgi:hypothetical protein
MPSASVQVRVARWLNSSINQFFSLALLKFYRERHFSDIWPPLFRFSPSSRPRLNFLPKSVLRVQEEVCEKELAREGRHEQEQASPTISRNVDQGLCAALILIAWKMSS